MNGKCCLLFIKGVGSLTGFIGSLSSNIHWNLRCFNAYIKKEIQAICILFCLLH